MQKERSPIACVGFIMDGNRRWATAQGVSTLEGHRQGVEVFEEVVRCMNDHHIPHAVFYAFSSENWRREEAEVVYLLKLFEENIMRARQELAEGTDDTNKNVTFKFVGDRAAFSSSLQEHITALEKKTAGHDGVTVWVALSYGGRAEIVAAANKAVAAGELVSEEGFEDLLWTASMPHPDLIVRTGGQHRLSNFLLWQAAYSEFFFSDTLWPDFSAAALGDIISDFSARQRNFGK